MHAQRPPADGAVEPGAAPERTSGAGTGGGGGRTDAVDPGRDGAAACVRPHLAGARPSPVSRNGRHRSARSALHAYRALTAVLGTATEIRPALEGVVGAVGELTGADAAAIVVPTGQTYVVACSWGGSPVEEHMRDDNLPDILRQGMAVTATRAVVDEGRLLALIWCGRTKERPFDTVALDVLRDVAHLTGRCWRAMRQGDARRLFGPADPLAAPAVREPAAGDAVDGPGAPDAHPGIVPRTETSAPLAAADLSAPMFAPALVGVLRATEAADVPLGVLRDAVTMDPAFTCTVFEAARFVGPGLTASHVSLSEACTVLGVRGIREAALTALSRGIFARSSLVTDLLWQQALGAAAAMQSAFEDQGPEQAEDAFLAGLLHNLGALALATADPAQYEALVDECARGERDWASAERAAFGTTSAIVTRDLVRPWPLPQAVVHALEQAASGDPARGRLADTLPAARAAALQASPAWRAVLGDRPPPSWHAAQARILAHSKLARPDVAKRLRTALATRVEAAARERDACA